MKKHVFFMILIITLGNLCPIYADTLPEIPPTNSTLSRYERRRQQAKDLKNVEQVVTRVVTTHKGAPSTVISPANKEDQDKVVLIKKEVHKLLEQQYEDGSLRDKKISLKIKSASIQDALDLISSTSGTSFIIDQDIIGNVEGIKFHDISLAAALRLLLSAHNPPLALIKDLDVWRIMKLSSATELLKFKAYDVIENDYHSDCVTLYNVKWEDTLKLRVEKLWQGIIGVPSQIKGSFVAFDDTSHKVFFRGRSHHVNDFKKFLHEIDVKIPQVRIDARVILANKDFDETIGFKWSGYYDRRSSVNNFSFAGAGSKEEPKDGMFGDALGWALNFLPTPIRAAHAGGIRLPFLWGDRDFKTKRLNLMLNAAENRSEIKTIIKPSLLVNTGEWAEILVGEELPHETRVSENVEGSFSNVTATHYKDIGTKIKVKPTVLPGCKTVLLDVFVENSSVSMKNSHVQISTLPSAQGGGTFNYAIETSRSQNRVLLKDGQTTLIGGLIINSKENVKTGVPGLQDIPLLGLLFQGKKNALVDKQLLIFITPTLT